MRPLRILGRRARSWPCHARSRAGPPSGARCATNGDHQMLSQPITHRAAHTGDQRIHHCFQGSSTEREHRVFARQAFQHNTLPPIRGGPGAHPRPPPTPPRPPSPRSNIAPPASSVPPPLTGMTRLVRRRQLTLARGGAGSGGDTTETSGSGAAGAGAVRAPPAAPQFERQIGRHSSPTRDRTAARTEHSGSLLRGPAGRPPGPSY